MNMKEAWRQELTIVLVISIWLGLLGLALGYVTEALLLALIGYIGWHLYQVSRLSLWLSSSKRHSPPYPIGLWGAVVQQVSELRERGRRRKRRLARMLSGFQESTSALPDATVVLNEQGELEWWNEVASRMLGLDRKRDKGRPIAEVISDPVFRGYLEEGAYQRPLHMPAPVARNINLEVRIVPYGKGKLLLQARDITRLSQLETIRRDFVANVSHEMRTPLTVIHGYLETMADSGDEGLKPWADILGQMHQQTERMQRIVGDLLLLSRLETQDDTQGQSLVDMAALLDGLKESAIGLSGEQNHIIELEVEPGLNLFGNASELDSAFSNLVFNAVRYTPAGGRIRLRWWREQGKPCFSVTDTGIGIAPEHLPRLTERFYRVDVGRSRQSGGTGLGLAIVKHVLTRHGSKLCISSEPGRGSTFHCCFPASRARLTGTAHPSAD